MSGRLNRIKGDQVLCKFCGKWEHKSSFRVHKKRVDKRCPYHGRCFECRRKYRIENKEIRKKWDNNFYNQNPDYRTNYSKIYRNSEVFQDRLYKNKIKETIAAIGEIRDDGYVYVLARPGSSLIIYGRTRNYKKRMKDYYGKGDYKPIFIGRTMDSASLEKLVTYTLKYQHKKNRGILFEKLHATDGDRFVLLDSLSTYCDKVILCTKPIISIDQWDAACPTFGATAYTEAGRGSSSSLG